MHLTTEVPSVSDRPLAADTLGRRRYLQATGAAALATAGLAGTLSGGDDATVDLPGNAPLTFNEAFEVRENTRTSFTADFAPVRRGTGSYLLRPVPSGIEVSYDTDGGDEDADGGDADGNEG